MGNATYVCTNRARCGHFYQSGVEGEVGVEVENCSANSMTEPPIELPLSLPNCHFKGLLIHTDITTPDIDYIIREEVFWKEDCC